MYALDRCFLQCTAYIKYSTQEFPKHSQEYSCLFDKSMDAPLDRVVHGKTSCLKVRLLPNEILDKRLICLNYNVGIDECQDIN